MMQILFWIAVLAALAVSAVAEQTVELLSNGIKIGGQYKILRGGSVQWFRLPEEEWEDRLIRFKAMGFNLVDMYVSWRNHEPKQGVYDFTTFNIVKFLDLTVKHKLYVYFRPGPYITNEMDGGGYPWWLRAKSDKRKYDPLVEDGTFNLRTDDKDFVNVVVNYFNALNNVIRPYLYTNGGNIVLYAVENELDWMIGSFAGDKLADLPDGKRERPADQEPDMVNYMNILRDTALASNITVPITTCPGDGYLGGMNNVSGIAPFPNIYYELKTIELSLMKLRNLLKQPNSPYSNYPIGVTETTRDNWVLRRLLLGGADIISMFDIMSFHQEGRQNGITFNMPSFYGYSSSEIMTKFMTNGFYRDPVRPFRIAFGLFPGNIDMNAAISPSGQLRDKFYHIKRTNMFIDAFSDLIAPVESPWRTRNQWSKFERMNKNVTVFTERVGSPDLTTGRMHYWMELGNQTALLGLLNLEGKKDLFLPKLSINAFGLKFPQKSYLTVPFERVDHSRNSESTYEMFIPINFPMGNSKVILKYASSEILSLVEFPTRSVVVVYNVEGSQGEVLLGNVQLGKSEVNATLMSILNPSNIHSHPMDSTNFISTDQISNEKAVDPLDPIVFSHLRNSMQSLLLKGDYEFQMIALETSEADKTWIVEHQKYKIIVIGPDFIKQNGDEIEFQVQSSTKFIRVITPVEPKLKLGRLVSYDPVQMVAIYDVATDLEEPAIELDLKYGSVSKIEGPPADFKNSILLGNEPDYLERQGISGGFVWYQAQVHLEKDQIKDNLEFWGDFASDFVGIYVNNKYALTLFPVGTEIDSTNSDPKIGFNIPSHYWREGTNYIAFKVEVWGAGSFMFPRGRLNKISILGLTVPVVFSKVSLPAIGCDSLKGLAGKYSIGGTNLSNWKLKAVPDTVIGSKAPMKNNQFPIELRNGTTMWYNTVIDTNSLVKTSEWVLPVSLKLQGKNTKATIFLNDRLIARWISDDEWLRRGNWGNPVRDLWTWFVSVDEISISAEILKTQRLHKLSIQFEDVSDSLAGAFAQIDSIQLVSTREVLVDSVNATTFEKTFNFTSKNFRILQ